MFSNTCGPGVLQRCQERECGLALVKQMHHWVVVDSEGQWAAGNCVRARFSSLLQFEMSSEAGVDDFLQ